VKKRFFDLDNQCEVRCLSASRHRLTQISNNIYAESLLENGRPKGTPDRIALRWLAIGLRGAQR
jgi:hypothetical protein